MISIIKNNINLTTYNFYAHFIKEIALEIKQGKSIELKLVENGDNLIHESNYRIDPITIPLLLSLIEQLSKHYNKPIKLNLYNNEATKSVLKFLNSSDFFNIAGNNKNPYYPYGRNILEFNDEYLGDFRRKSPRPEHRVRCYSLRDNNLAEKIRYIDDENIKRDILISENIYSVRENFQELLFENINTEKKTDFYIEILSELITNGILHSKSDTFALMFVNRYATKFSISDNGIGFEESLKTKKDDLLYKPFELKKILDEYKILNLNNILTNNLNYIIETLYYSALKDRRGLFDLLISVVLNSNGYFRLHTNNTQIIISNRMRNDLVRLSELRDSIFHMHKSISINKIEDGRFNEKMISIKNEIKNEFIHLFKNLSNKYNNDYQYSSIRFYNVRFKGVHIEVEIPTI